MPLDHFAAVAVVSILAALAVFQILLIAGAPLGLLAWGGQHRILPRKLRVSSAVSVLTYGIFAYAALAKADLATSIVGDGVLDVVIWVLTFYFALGIILNGISRSKPERFTMTPVALLLTAFYLILALN